MPSRTVTPLGLLVLAAAAATAGGPPTREEADRRAKVVDQLKQAFAAEPTAAGRLAVVTKLVRDEPSEAVRATALDAAAALPGAERDAALAAVLAGDPDAGVRGRAAVLLGRVGTDGCLPALARAAATDPTTDMTIGCMRGRSSARRDATFAVAELAARFPKLSAEATASLRALDPPAVSPNGEGLADARLQALYQITRDEALVKPFYDRLRSPDARTRVDGVVAFQFLKLTTAPAEIVAALKDTDPDVRSWAILVLGRIGDPKTVPLLLTLAVDPKADAGLRSGAIGAVGQMRAAAATETLRTLLTDDTESVRVAAAIALYRVTGEKTKAFPPGYNAD